MSEQTDLFGGADTVATSMERDALLSPCGTYRYRLTRTWDANLPRLGWIMLNPSTADARVDDPTIRKCIGFAKRAGCRSIVVTNLFAFRATDPKELKKRAPRMRSRVGSLTHDVSTVVGPENDRRILEAVREAALTILAWGAHGDLGGRDSTVLRMLEDEGLHEGWRARTAVLAYTGDKSKPRHPLYLKYELIDSLVGGPTPDVSSVAG